MKKKLLNSKFFVLEKDNYPVLSEAPLEPRIMDVKTFSAELYLNVNEAELYRDLRVHPKLSYIEFCYLIYDISRCFSVDIQPSNY